MASRTTKKTTRKSAPKKRELSEAARLRRNRMWSSVLFILGVFVIFLTYIKGQNFWMSVHDFLWGMMGVSVVLFAPIILYVAVMLAMDRSKSAVVTKVIQGGVLMLLVSPLFEIVYRLSNTLTPINEIEFKRVFSILYDSGKEMKGGGALSFFLGWTLSWLCGTAGALIIIILLILLFAMLLTNKTPVDVWQFFAGMFRRAGDAIRENGEEQDRAPQGKADRCREVYPRGRRKARSTDFRSSAAPC